MASVFQRESRSVQRFVGLPTCTKARLWPTVAAILDGERAAHVEISDQIVLGALNESLIKGIVAGDYFGVHASLGKILGLDVPAGMDVPAPVAALPSREAVPQPGSRRPLAKAAR